MTIRDSKTLVGSIKLTSDYRTAPTKIAVDSPHDHPLETARRRLPAPSMTCKYHAPPLLTHLSTMQRQAWRSRDLAPLYTLGTSASAKAAHKAATGRLLLSWLHHQLFRGTAPFLQLHYRRLEMLHSTLSTMC